MASLAVQLGVRKLTARILVGRGIRDASVANRFLLPRLSDLRPPGPIADLERALTRLAQGLARGDRFGVFGDYDVDGVTSAAVLTLGLRAMGGEVVPRVASRHSGYGLRPEVAQRFVDEGCRVLVTGDCGTSDHEALALCRAAGVDVIVIDHHQVPDGETAAFALINPHRRDCLFAFKGLASCGIAFYMMAALRSRLRTDGLPAAAAWDPRELLDVVALGTIADMVPLIEENRILTTSGLRELSARRRPGLRALLALAECDPAAPVTATDVAFRIAPRLNAAGRLGEAQLALDVLLATDDQTAQALAAELDGRNRERQQVQERVWAEAQLAAEALGDAAAIVIGAEGWHPGVVGIIAAKIVDRFRRPAVVVGFQDGIGRGSARTIGDFNLYRALDACRGHLAACGGHAAAAGLTVQWNAFPAFVDAFCGLADQHRRAALGEAPVSVDAVADLCDLDLGQVEELGRLAPFGTGNCEILLVLPGVRASSSRIVGKGHLQLTLAHGASIGDAIAFGMGDRAPADGEHLDVIACAEVDSFRGSRRARLRVKHLLPVMS